MGREMCVMCEIAGGKVYCSYYDFMYMLCEEQDRCPDGLDDDEDENIFQNDIMDAYDEEDE